MLYRLLFIIAIMTPCLVRAEIRFGLGLETSFPTQASLGVSMRSTSGVIVFAGLGILPSTYSQAIGSFTASSSGNGGYQNLVEDALEKNWLLHLKSQYHFSSKKRWFIGTSLIYLESQGSSSLTNTLAVATGRDYTILQNLLNLANKEDKITLDGEMFIGEIYGGYRVPLGGQLHLFASFGFSFVLQVDTDMTTELPNFDASSFGSSLLNDSESDLEAVVLEYGLAPSISLGLQYWF